MIKFHTETILCKTFNPAAASNDNEKVRRRHMRRLTFNKQQAGSILCALLLLTPTASLMAQDPAPAATLLPADQLDDLVAPIALYPDSLLGQVFAASTYPLELVEAQQWLRENRALDGRRLMDAARQQNWDPSVQAIVAFPNVLDLLNRDIRWTTDLGNAFLAQQADVMDAVQRMRARARDNGRLATTPQQTVTQNQSAIEIQPANPQIVYVPSYNPAYVWGSPAYGAYPALGYPDASYGFGFNPGVLIGAIFQGLMSFGPWGWALNFLTHGLFLNNLFLGHFGFGGLGFGGFGGSALAARSVWEHNPAHRLGVAYPNHMVAGHFASARSYAGGSNARAYSAPRARAAETSRASSYAAPRSYQATNRSVEGSRYNSPSTSYRSSSSRGIEGSRYNSPSASYRSSSNYRNQSKESSSRYSAPKMPHNSAPRASHMNAPKMSSPKGHSGGHSSGGHSGKHK